MNQRYWSLLLILLLSLSLVACGGGEDPAPPATSAPQDPAPTSAPQEAAPTEAPQEPTAPPPATEIEVRDATFAHGLSEQMEALEPSTDFQPEETIYLSVRINGRPEEGIVTARFFWKDAPIAEAQVDLGDVNSGLIFSIGQDTYAGYTLTHEQPFPVSEGYRAEVFHGDKALGAYHFRIVPPAEAIPTQISEVTLARGADENYDPVEPTTTFAAGDTVHLVGHGDLGIATWLQADWYVDGTMDEAGTRSLSLSENASDVGFAFSFIPEGGWPSGEHYVIMTVNGEEMGPYTFLVEE